MPLTDSFDVNFPQDFRKLPANASDDDIAAEAVKYKMELFDNKCVACFKGGGRGLICCEPLWFFTLFLFFVFVLVCFFVLFLFLFLLLLLF